VNSFVFWQRWLVASCFLFGGVGIAVAIAGDSPPFAAWNAGIREVFSNGAPLSPESTDLKSFMLGPLGGTILGSYVLCGFIAAGPFARRERWAWTAITASLLSWFVLDSAVSIAHGAYFNVYLINLVTLFGQGLPLAMTAREFWRAVDQH
jgi:hypothetical protein